MVSYLNLIPTHKSSYLYGHSIALDDVVAAVERLQDGSASGVVMFMVWISVVRGGQRIGTGLRHVQTSRPKEPQASGLCRSKTDVKSATVRLLLSSITLRSCLFFSIKANRWIDLNRQDRWLLNLYVRRLSFQACTTKRLNRLNISCNHVQ